MIGEKIRKARQDKGLSIDSLVEISKVSRPMIWKVEKNLTNPSVRILEKLCKSLGINLKDLFKEDSKSKYTNVILDNMKVKKTSKKAASPDKQKKSKLSTAGEVISSVEKELTIEEKIKAENKKEPIKQGLVFNKEQLLALAELQLYTQENSLPCFEILVNIPNYLNEKVFTRKELDALKSIVFYIASNKFDGTDIDKVAKELKDFLLAHGESEVKVILSFNKSDDSEVA